MSQDDKAKHCNFVKCAAGMLGCGHAGTFQQLLLWRWVTGIGSALQMAGAQLFLADISLSSNRARTLGTNQVSCPKPKQQVEICSECSESSDALSL